MKSYDRFYNENKDRLFAYLSRMTGDYQRSLDVMQESFTRYFSRYRQNAPSRALLYTIAKNTALDVIRKDQREASPRKKELLFEGNPERQLIDKEGCDMITAAIQKLSPIDRELISLVSARVLSYKEIGAMLNISEANVKVKVHRARLRLKAILEKRGQ